MFPCHGPRLHLIRFHAVLAPNAKSRAKVGATGPRAGRRQIGVRNDERGRLRAQPASVHELGHGCSSACL